MKPSPLIRPRPDGFTLLEVMLAILIFSLVISAIYSIWLFIIKGSTLGLDAAMATQRSRITMRALEDAFTTSAMYTPTSRITSSLPTLSRIYEFPRTVAITVMIDPCLGNDKHRTPFPNRLIANPDLLHGAPFAPS